MSVRSPDIVQPQRPLPETGIGLRAPHVRQILAEKPNAGFLEAHSENYFGGGPARADLLQLRKDYPISLHGVGLSLGRADGLDASHLDAIAVLVRDVDPFLVSEHISWSAIGDKHVPDLLPLPMTNEALDVICRHVDEFQEAVGRQILVENPSSYLRFSEEDMTEPAFLDALTRRTGCGLLLDINNIYVSAQNIGFDPYGYLEEIPPSAVHEMHLAGYQVNDIGEGQQMLIDTHGKPVHPPVWDLYEKALQRFGDTTTLLEWDTDIPELATLVAGARKADGVRQRAAQVREGNHAISV